MLNLVETFLVFLFLGILNDYLELFKEMKSDIANLQQFQNNTHINQLQCYYNP